MSIPMDIVAEPAPDVVARGLPSVLKRTLRLACGGVLTAALPVIACSAAFQLALVAAGVLVIGDDGLIVNGEIRTRAWTPGIVGYGGAAILALLAAHVAAVAAVVLIAAGRLLDRPVTARSAAGVVARRAPALAVSVPLIGGALLAVPAVGGGVLLLTGELWVGIFAYAVAGVMTCWSVLAVPLVVLEGAGPVRAMARSWDLTRHRRARWSWFVLAAVLLLPGALASGLSALALPLDDEAFAIAVRPAAVIADALVVLLQGTSLAVITLNQWYPDVNVWRERRRPLDLKATARSLPTAPRRPRPGRAAVLAALTLASPGLLQWALLRTDPYDLTMTSDHRVEVPYGRTVLMLPDGTGPAALTAEAADGFALRRCGDRTCRDSREAARAELVRNVDAAALPGGSVVVAGWLSDISGIDVRDLESGAVDEVPPLLRLIACTPRGCPPMRDAPGTMRIAAAGAADDPATAVAASGSAIVAAAVSRVPDSDDGFSDGGFSDAGTLRVVRCTRLPCARPETLATVRTPDLPASGDKPLTVAVGPSGRPVAALHDRSHGGIIIVSCDDADCKQPRTTRLGHRYNQASQDYDRFLDARDTTQDLAEIEPDAVEAAVPADDRPVITYRDMLTGAATMLRCRTRDCASADRVVLSPSGLAQQAPALALGRDGLPLIAVNDLTDSSVTLIACRDPGCAHRDKTRIGTYKGAPDPLDLAVGRDGLPRLLWGGGSDDALHLTTCHAPRCAGR